MSGRGLGVGLVLALLVGVLAYLVGLDGQHIPHIGDEAPYFQITRKTAEAGHWLPIATAEGLGQTKPPLLFWMGIVSTGWGRTWTLWALRLPVVAFTFLTAFLAYLAATGISGRRRDGAVAALSFLALFSTFQYGRPFLTNLPETFFVFLPFAVAAARPARLDRWGFWILAGISTGLACLVKSFALVVPVAFAFLLWGLVRRRGDVRAFLRHDLGKGLFAALLALGLFALWPLLDPDPRAILDEFVIGENVGKVAGGGWLPGLVSQSHGIWTTLLGPFFNAGFLAPAVVWLVVDALRRRRPRPREAGGGRTGLWMLLLAFVFVFSLPSHRQSNYLLPAMPAVAVLLGLAWGRIGKFWLGATAFAVAVAALVAFLFQRAMAGEVLPAGAYAGWQRAVPAATFLLAAGVALRPGRARGLVHLLVFLAYLSLGAALAPFEGNAGRYAPEVIQAVRGREVWVPSNFRCREERYRFLLPGAAVRGYPAKSAAAVVPKLLDRGGIVAVRRAPGSTVSAGGERILGGRWVLRTRQTGEEFKALLLEQDVRVLVQREVILESGQAGEDER